MKIAVYSAAVEFLTRREDLFTESSSAWKDIQVVKTKDNTFKI